MVHTVIKRLIYAFAIVAVLTSCGETNNKLQGYEWLEGEWSGAAVQQIFVNITPQYYQIAGEMWDDEMDIAKADKKDFSIKIKHDTTLGDLKGICDGEDSATIYIDESKQSIFWIYDFDQKMYLSKSQANDYKGADNSDGEVPDGMWRLSTFSGQMSSGENNYNIELDISYPSDGEYGCPIKGRYGYAGNTDKISLEGEWMAATPTGNGLTIRLYSDEYKECFDLEYDGTDLLSTRTLEGTWSQYTNESDYSIETDPQKTLKVVLSEESTSWTNPSTPFVEYTLDPQYSWLIGSWTDGSDVISITEKDITVKRGKYVVDSGLYFIDWRGDINVQWKTGRFQDGLCLGENALAIEGGDWLIKLPEMEGGAISSSDIISALTESSKPYEGDVSWVYGLWKVPESKAEIFITPKYCQVRGENDSYLDGKGVQKLEKQEYTVTEDNNKLLGTVIRIGDYYLDPSSHRLYSLSGLDKKTYLEQTEKYVSPVIKYGKWLLIGFIGIAALVFLVILLIRLIKKAVAAIKQWRSKTKARINVKKQKAKEKVAEISQKTKEASAALVEKAKETATSVSQDAKTFISKTTGATKQKKISTPVWLLIIGGYLTLFLDSLLGLSLIVIAIAYLIAKKLAPEKTQHIIDVIKEKLNYFSSRPLLKHAVIWLLVGVLIYRLFSVIVGLLLIVFSVVFTALIKLSPAMANKIDALCGARALDFFKGLWRKKYVRIVVIGFFLLWPFVSIPRQDNFIDSTPIGENIQETIHKEDYRWIVGVWYCSTPYGTISIKFEGDGRSGKVTEFDDPLNPLSARHGTYHVENGELRYELQEDPSGISNVIEIHGMQLSSGGYNFKKIQ